MKTETLEQPVTGAVVHCRACKGSGRIEYKNRHGDILYPLCNSCDGTGRIALVRG